MDKKVDHHLAMLMADISGGIMYAYLLDGVPTYETEFPTVFDDGVILIAYPNKNLDKISFGKCKPFQDLERICQTKYGW